MVVHVQNREYRKNFITLYRFTQIEKSGNTDCQQYLSATAFNRTLGIVYQKLSRTMLCVIKYLTHLTLSLQTAGWPAVSVAFRPMAGSRLRTVVSLRRVQVSAGSQSPSPLVWHHHVSYSGPELVWETGRLTSPDRGFGTSCLLHSGHLTVSPSS